MDVILHFFIPLTTFAGSSYVRSKSDIIRYTHRTSYRRDTVSYDEILRKPFRVTWCYKRTIQYCRSGLYLRSKFNLHSAFKQERAQPCVGELSEVLRDLIYESLSTKDPRPPSLSQNFRLVTRYFRLCGGTLRRSYRTSPRSLLFYSRRIAPGLNRYTARIVGVNAKKSYDTRLSVQNFLFASASSLLFPQRRAGEEI